MSGLALVILSLATVQPHSPGEVGCVTASVSAADRALIASSLASGVPDEAATLRLLQGAAACAPRFEWDPRRTHRMGLVATATIGLESYAAALAANAIEPILINRWFATQSDAERTNTAFDDAWGAQVVAGLARAGMPEARLEGHGELVGAYVATLVVLERLRLGLEVD